MEKNILADFLNMIKSFASEALEKCENEEKQEEVVASDDVQVSVDENAPENTEDSIATTKGNEEKQDMEVEAAPEEAPVLEASEDETEGNPDTLKNVEVPEEKSDEHITHFL